MFVSHNFQFTYLIPWHNILEPIPCCAVFFHYAKCSFLAYLSTQSNIGNFVKRKTEMIMFRGVNILYRNVLRLLLMRNIIITTLKKNCSLYALNEKRRNNIWYTTKQMLTSKAVNTKHSLTIDHFVLYSVLLVLVFVVNYLHGWRNLDIWTNLFGIHTYKAIYCVCIKQGHYFKSSFGFQWYLFSMYM